MSDGAAEGEPAKRLTVELAGIPGAGKSRLARTLTEGLRARGVDVLQPYARMGPSVPARRRLLRKAVATATTAVAAPVTSARVVRGIARSGQPATADLSGRLVQWLVAQDSLAAAHRHGGVVLVDEGPIQALWSIGLRGDLEPVLAALDGAHRWRSSDLLVVVQVSPELALARLAARSSQHSRTQLLPEPERLAELRRGARVLDRLVDWWSSGRAPRPRDVLVLQGTDESAADRERLVERLAASIDPTNGQGPAADS